MKTWLATGLFAMVFGGTLVTAQEGLVVNIVQQSLLSLEAETPAFRHFHGLTIQDFLAKRDRGEELEQGALLEAKADARALRVLAQAMIQEAESLSEGLHLTPGVELDADTMYRVSAWELRRFFGSWSRILTEIQDAETSSPASFWRFTEELEHASDAYEMSRIYRLLANQQYVLERSGMLPF